MSSFDSEEENTPILTSNMRTTSVPLSDRTNIHSLSMQESNKRATAKSSSASSNSDEQLAAQFSQLRVNTSSSSSSSRSSSITTPLKSQKKANTDLLNSIQSQMMSPIAILEEEMKEEEPGRKKEKKLKKRLIPPSSPSSLESPSSNLSSSPSTTKIIHRSISDPLPTTSSSPPSSLSHFSSLPSPPPTTLRTKNITSLFNTHIRTAKTFEKAENWIEALREYESAAVLREPMETLLKKLKKLRRKVEKMKQEEHQEEAEDEEGEKAADDQDGYEMKIVQNGKFAHDERKQVYTVLARVPSSFAPSSSSATTIRSNSSRLTPYSLPASLCASLFPYQRDTIEWMWNLHAKCEGGILGDDMGLGKTVQIATYIAGAFYSHAIKRVLLIAPNGVIKQWARELEKWAGAKVVDAKSLKQKGRKSDKQKDGLRLLLFTGSDSDSDIVLSELNDIMNSPTSGGIVLTTYGLVSRRLNALTNFTSKKKSEAVWDYGYLDEGHLIKNPDTQLYQSLLQIPIQRRFILSGTPILNNLDEIWSLTNWFSKGTLLGNRTDFTNEFTKPFMNGIKKGATLYERDLGQQLMQEIHRRISSYFLRRDKSILSKNQLSIQKNDFIVWIHMSPLQIALYSSFLKSDQVKAIFSKTRSPLVALQVLKKIVSHPRLLNKEMKQLRKDGCDMTPELRDLMKPLKFVEDMMMVAEEEAGKRKSKKSGVVANASVKKSKKVIVEEEDEEEEDDTLPDEDEADQQQDENEEDEEQARPASSAAATPSKKHLPKLKRKTLLDYSSEERAATLTTLLEESTKLRILEQLLRVNITSGHRTLVFSQSLRLLAFITLLLHERGWKHIRIDGTVVGSGERQRRMDLFNQDASYPVLLLSTRAGSVGLNLTGANRVIIFDPDWTPSTDNQAVDRAFRIGQTRNVIVHRFITCGTVEEVMYRKQVFKGSVIKAAMEMEGGDPNSAKAADERKSMSSSTSASDDSSSSPLPSSVNKDEIIRYFSHQELRDVFGFSDPFQSETYTQLLKMHPPEMRRSYEELDAHTREIVQWKDIHGITDHDQLFKDVAKEEEHDYALHNVDPDAASQVLDGEDSHLSPSEMMQRARERIDQQRDEKETPAQARKRLKREKTQRPQQKQKYLFNLLDNGDGGAAGGNESEEKEEKPSVTEKKTNEDRIQVEQSDEDEKKEEEDEDEEDSPIKKKSTKKKKVIKEESEEDDDQQDEVYPSPKQHLSPVKSPPSSISSPSFNATIPSEDETEMDDADQRDADDILPPSDELHKLNIVEPGADNVDADASDSEENDEGGHNQVAFEDALSETEDEIDLTIEAPLATSTPLPLPPSPRPQPTMSPKKRQLDVTSPTTPIEPSFSAPELIDYSENESEDDEKDGEEKGEDDPIASDHDDDEGSPIITPTKRNRTRDSLESNQSFEDAREYESEVDNAATTSPSAATSSSSSTSSPAAPSSDVSSPSPASLSSLLPPCLMNHLVLYPLADCTNEQRLEYARLIDAANSSSSHLDQLECYLQAFSIADSDSLVNAKILELAHCLQMLNE